ncbi:hypothetical protein [uncultured Flavobacterium sp.]|uniref:hypothetical protein n=1 Tax=uncultured Flavobacterium sp. TaxID=165435 RepID=UPI0025FBB9A5|nr:hypothetical protein [uncultured Flavobacterium sp.]
MNTLKIRDYIFPVDTSRTFIKEYNHEDFGETYTVWDIWVQSEEAPFVGEGTFSGNIRCEQMIATQGNLQSLAGKTIQVKDAYDYLNDEYLFTFYMLTHNGVKDNEITFGKIEGNKVHVHWKGVLEEPGFEGPYNIDVPFELSCELEIKAMVADEDYHNPVLVVKEHLSNVNDNYENNSFIISCIIDITDHYTLDEETYQSIIELLSSGAFLKTFEDMDKIEYFISNFTYQSDDRAYPVPEKISNEALARWEKVPLLQDIMKNL